MIAGLPMYDWDETLEQTDAFWNAIAGALQDAGFENVPESLERKLSVYDLWTSPDLLIGQTCGYPLMTALKDRCTYVATPIYGVSGCEGPFYSSAIMARESNGPDTLPQAKGMVAAVNGPDSMSGHIALRAAFAPFAENGRFFSGVVLSGSHGASMVAVRDNEADICAIDCVSLAMAKRYQPDLIGGLKVIGYSPLAPGLPLISQQIAQSDVGEDSELYTLRNVLKNVYSAAHTRTIRESLFILGLAVLTTSDYVRVLEIESGGSSLRILD